MILVTVGYDDYYSALMQRYCTRSILPQLGDTVEFDDLCNIIFYKLDMGEISEPYRATIYPNKDHVIPTSEIDLDHELWHQALSLAYPCKVTLTVVSVHEDRSIGVKCEVNVFDNSELFLSYELTYTVADILQVKLDITNLESSLYRTARFQDICSSVDEEILKTGPGQVFGSRDIPICSSDNYDWLHKSEITFLEIATTPLSNMPTGAESCRDYFKGTDTFGRPINLVKSMHSAPISYILVNGVYGVVVCDIAYPKNVLPKVRLAVEVPYGRNYASAGSACSRTVKFAEIVRKSLESKGMVEKVDEDIILI